MVKLPALFGRGFFVFIFLKKQKPPLRAVRKSTNNIVTGLTGIVGGLWFKLVCEWMEWGFVSCVIWCGSKLLFESFHFFF